MSNEGYTDSAAKETDTDNNDVDIPDDCRNLFTRLIDEIEATNNKIKLYK